MYRPFVDDPNHLALLEGQRYVALRPAGPVSAVHEQVRASVKERLAGLPVSYPAQAHVTLTGFPKGTDLESVRALVGQWARTIPRLQLEVERVGVFPAPFQIVIVQVRKTAELFDALASLRESARQRKFGDVLTTPAADWIFHMSVAYCASLSASAWADVMRFVEKVGVPAAQCSVSDVEIVAFDNGREHCGGVFALSATGGDRHE